MDPADVKQAVRPLRLIFWGGLILVVDVWTSFTSGDVGFRFDILNDAVGAIMVAAGVSRLGRFQVHARYSSAMAFVRVMAVVAIVQAVYQHLIWPEPPILSFGLALVDLVSLAATVTFIVAMRWLCDVAGLVAASRSWRTTFLLFIVIYVVPLGALCLAGLIAVATRQSWQLNVNNIVVGIVAVLVFFIPLIHLFISTSRMAREAAHDGGGDGIGPQGPPYER